MADLKICLILETSMLPDSLQTNNCLLVQFCTSLLRQHLHPAIGPLLYRLHVQIISLSDHIYTQLLGHYLNKLLDQSIVAT